MSKIVHIEIPAPDLDKAKEFYSRLFGWKVEITPEMDYAGWSPPDEDAVGGGFDKSYRPTNDGILLHIGVDNIEAKLREIEAAGGKVLKGKTKISDEHGYYAEFTDVFGNKLALWSKE